MSINNNGIKPKLKPSTLPPSSFQGEGTILLVDDDPSIRLVGTRMLEKLHFSVLCAKDGVEALATYRLHKSDIRMVVMDLTMPQMDGEETYYQLRKIDTNVPILIVSGHDETEVAHRLIGEKQIQFIPKPYRMHDLAHKLRDILDSSPIDSTPPSN